MRTMREWDISLVTLAIGISLGLVAGVVIEVSNWLASAAPSTIVVTP